MLLKVQSSLRAYSIASITEQRTVTRPIVKVAKTIKRHWECIISWKESQINNEVLEGLNSVIQAEKRKA